MTTYTKSDLNAALVAMVEKCAELVPCSYCDNHVLLEGESHVWRSESQLLTRPCTRALIRAALPADIVASVAKDKRDFGLRLQTALLDGFEKYITNGNDDDSIYMPTSIKRAVERERRKLQLEARIAEAKWWANPNCSCNKLVPGDPLCSKCQHVAALEAELDKPPVSNETAEAQ